MPLVNGDFSREANQLALHQARNQFSKRGGGYLIKAIYSRPSSRLSLRRVLSCRWKNLQYPRRWHPANSRDKLLIIISILGEVTSRPCRRLRSIHTSPAKERSYEARDCVVERSRINDSSHFPTAETYSLYK